VAPSSSAKKVAKLSSRGKGKRVCFQGGTVFPAIVAVVVVVMLGLVVYARASLPTGGSGAPRLGDHWHAAYGFYICDEKDDSAAFLPNLIGTKEDQSIDPQTGNNVYTDKHFRLYGIHSHGDGVIHYHPYSSRATGSRARLGVFLDAYNIKLTDTQLEFPADQGGQKFDTKDYKCNGQDSQLRVRVWNSFAKPGEQVDYVTDFKNIRIDRNGMAFTIAIVPKGKDIPQPPSAPKLPELGAVDGGAQITVPGAAGTGVTGSDVTGTSGTGTGVTGTDVTGSTPVSSAGSTATTSAAGATVPDTGAATTVTSAAAATVAAASTTGG
jgi:hypothetical protein